MAKGSVRKKGKKWYYRFYVEDASGNRVQKEFPGTESKSETESLLRKAMEDYETKMFLAQAKNITLGDMLDMWVEEELKPGSLSDGTVTAYINTVSRIKKHPIGKRKLKTVTSDHLQSYMDLLSFGGTDPDGKTVEALSKVGIPEPEKRMNSYPYELSGGMCQRVIIAMAVCCKPKLIIADEPTTALDVTVQAQVLELLKELQRDMDTAILLITHNLGVVWEMCDKVMVMYAGNTVEFTDTKTLYSNPRHPYTWGLLDSMPKLSDESKGELKTIPGTPPDLRLTGECCNFYNRCPYVTEACTQSVPPLVEVEPGHFVACHRQNLTNKLEKGEGLKDE